MDQPQTERYDIPFWNAAKKPSDLGWHRHALERPKFLLTVLLFVLSISFVMKNDLLCSLSALNPVFSQSRVGARSKTSLFLNDDSFKITIFNDLHYGEGEDNPPEWGWGPLSDNKTTKVIESVLMSESGQQLVVLNGDLITGENTHFHNSTLYLDQMVKPIVHRNIPFASTYGNHDNQFNLSTAQLFHAEKTRYPKYSFSQRMVHHPQAGISNYYILVYQHENSKRPSLILWFFDSRGGSEYQRAGPQGERISIPGHVHPAVAKWLKETDVSLKHKYKSVIPSLAFVHIPIYAAASFQSTGVDPYRQPGINDDDPLSPQGIQDDVYTGADIPFMKALLNTQGLLAVFSGHDHGDDWCAQWKNNRRLPDMDLLGNGLFLCFGRHTGYGGYGRWMRGSRQVLLDLSHKTPELQTWIRLEDGSVTGSVALNSTYGQDRYSRVKRKFT